jgi:hypothetical protein
MTELIEGAPEYRVEKHNMPRKADPNDLLVIAVERGASMGELEALLALQLRWEANEARKAFAAAMTEFRANVPVISKDKQVKFGSRSGGASTDYWHATLSNITKTINPLLAQCNLTFAWSTEQSGGQVTVHCDVTHVAGHTIRTSLTAGLDTSGNKNPIQQIGSTVTYLQRYTLNAALGLSTEDDDDDGGGGDKYISEVQAATIKRALMEVNGDTKRFLRAYGGNAECVDQIPADLYERAIAALEARAASTSRPNGKGGANATGN